MQLVRHARGARILDGNDVLSEIRATPGPTHTLFDVLAAGVAGLSPGPRVAVLGFAGGGIVAPLRAMGWNTPLDGVDLSRHGERVFRQLSASWAGEIRVDEDDAVRWLRRRRRRWDAILEDISLTATKDREGVKPQASLRDLPALMAARLASHGVAIVNLLPMPDMPWRQVMQPFAAHFRCIHVVSFAGYVNRVLVVSQRRDTARHTGSRLRRVLHRIESAMALEIGVRTLARSRRAR